MILNQDYDFARDAPARVKASFIGMPAKVLAPARETLYRFITLGHNTVIAQDWMPKETFLQFLEWSRRTGISLPLIARNRLAVMYEWNPKITALCVIELKPPVYGFKGPAKHQALSLDKPNVRFIGGSLQVFVPNLSEQDVFLANLCSATSEESLSDQVLRMSRNGQLPGL